MQMPPVLPVDIEDVLMVVFLGLVMLIPVIGVTARFALKPIAESLAKFRELQGRDEAQALLERRIALIEQELNQLGELRADVRTLVEEHEFRRKLQK